MTRPLRSYVCQGCGLPIIRPRRVDRPKLCTECAIARSMDNAYRRREYGLARRAILARQRVAVEV